MYSSTLEKQLVLNFVIITTTIIRLYINTEAKGFIDKENFGNFPDVMTPKGISYNDPRSMAKQRINLCN